MSEIRNKAEKNMKKIVLATYHAGSIGTNISDVLEVAVKEVFSIPELAIVDRGAELPENPYPCWSEMNRESAALSIYRRAQQDMLEAGWLKEDKDEASNTA